MGEPTYDIPPVGKPLEKRLDSWKEIAVYLNRDVTTVQRWEKREGMPVHRHVHDKRGSVYALADELDNWVQSRRSRPEETNPDETSTDETGRNEPLADEPEEAPETVTASVAPIVRRAAPARKAGLWFAVGTFVCLCLLAAGWLAFRQRETVTVAPKIRSLAVLPLRNLSGDSAQDYLADGITEAVIGRLAGIHDLRVVSHTSVMRFRNAQLSIPEIAKTLSVDALVEGSVIKDGNRIRVTAQLIRGATDEHIWSETYDRDLQDSLTMESQLAQSIAEKVAVSVTGEERQRLRAARPIAPEIYESYLKGLAVSEGSRDGDEQSIPYFEDALKRDPTFAPAYLGLAQAYTNLGTVFAGSSPGATRPKVITYARKALDLDPDLVEAHVVLANVLQEEWHWTEAEAEYRRALALNANDAYALASYALWLVCQGSKDEAVAAIQRARELDPTEVSGDSVSRIFFHAHRFEDAIRESRSASAVQPENALNLMSLGFALIANNQPAEAIPILEKALSLSKGSPAVMGVLIRAYAHAGRPGDAIRLLAELKQRRKAGYIPAGAFVNAYLGLGDTEQAFYWLEQAYKEQSNILQFLKTHPYFDPIRNDPRFAALVRRVGLG